MAVHVLFQQELEVEISTTADIEGEEAEEAFHKGEENNGEEGHPQDDDDQEQVENHEEKAIITLEKGLWD